jgi:glyoxylase-like metal-dependent hydrolase (beta-lactamase superfamily II)
MTIARRAVLATGAAIGALPLAGQAPAQAAAPLGAQQAPGFYRIKVGELEVTLVNDGVVRRPLDAGFVKNAELDAVKTALAAAFQPTDTLVIPFTTTVVNTGQKLVLIDSSNGAFGAPTTGQWLANFKAAGFAPEQVDAIIVSHFHGDHIGGIRGRDGALTFAKAEIMVPAAEWAFWMDDGQMSRSPEGMQGAFRNVRRVFEPIVKDVARYEGERELVPGITAIPAAGHTPGHTAYVVTSGASRLLVLSDAANKPELFVANPGWHAVFDMDGNEAAATRRRLLEMAVAERMPVTAYHFGFPAVGNVAKDGAGYRFVPAFWQPAA